MKTTMLSFLRQPVSTGDLIAVGFATGVIGGIKGFIDEKRGITTVQLDPEGAMIQFHEQEHRFIMNEIADLKAINARKSNND